MPTDSSRSDSAIRSSTGFFEAGTPLLASSWAGTDGDYRMITLANLTLLIAAFLLYWYVAGDTALKPPSAVTAGARVTQNKRVGPTPAVAALDTWQDLQKDLAAFVVGAVFANDVAIEPGTDEIVVSLAEPLLFSPGNAALQVAAFPVLEKIAAMVIAHADLSLAIGGLRDEIQVAGGETVNAKALSTARFSAAARYFVERGVHPSRIAVQGYGNQRAHRRDSTGADRPANRRVEVTLFRQPAAGGVNSEAQP